MKKLAYNVTVATVTVTYVALAIYIACIFSSGLHNYLLEIGNIGAN